MNVEVKIAMIILGDLACPDKNSAVEIKRFFNENRLIDGKLVICNLEGVIREDEPYEDEKLFNHPDVLDAFDNSEVVFSLANNHMYDYPELLEQTVETIESKGYKHNGIVTNNEVSPTLVSFKGQSYAIFCHCWRVYTHTNSNHTNNIRVNDCEYEAFYNIVSDYIANNPSNKVVCYFHWNYDLEVIPFPMHRKLARDLIDSGVFCVVGNHSHVPQGGEIYKGKAIVYGLGNFYIPSGKFFGGKLEYADESKITMSLEIDEANNSYICHWFKTDKGKPLEYLLSEDLINGKIILDYSKYRDVDISLYSHYFKSHRRKKLLVPTFENYKGIGNLINETWAITRIKLIKLIKGC